MDDSDRPQHIHLVRLERRVGGQEWDPLEPGDIIFTGTPAGVGSTRTPRRYLQAGEEIVSTIEGVGTLRNRCVPGGA